MFKLDRSHSLLPNVPPRCPYLTFVMMEGGFFCIVKYNQKQEFSRLSVQGLWFRGDQALRCPCIPNFGFILPCKKIMKIYIKFYYISSDFIYQAKQDFLDILQIYVIYLISVLIGVDISHPPPQNYLYIKDKRKQEYSQESTNLRGQQTMIQAVNLFLNSLQATARGYYFLEFLIHA